MKALTVYQPYAALIAIGAKPYEFRPRRLNYRGTVAIHAGKKDPHKTPLLELQGFEAAVNKAFEASDAWSMLPLGAVIAVVDIVDCERITAAHGSDWAQTVTSAGAINFISNDYLIFGNPKIGDFAYRIDNIRRLPHPIPCRGQQGLFTLPPEIERDIMEVLK
jgi:hypothetical protein